MIEAADDGDIEKLKKLRSEDYYFEVVSRYVSSAMLC